MRRLKACWTAIDRACIALVILVVFAACESSRSYEVRGRVAGFSDDDRTLIVEHESVPGLMPAMTMPFTVRDSSTLHGLRVRDAVAFELTLSGDSSWIDNIRLLADTAVAEHPAGSRDESYGSRPMPEILQVGDAVPQTELVTHADTTLHLAELEGKAVLLTFIYTRCPIPNFCPLMSRHFADLQPVLEERYDELMHLVSVSFDPSHDTPEVLRNYAAHYTDDLSTWTFASGDSASVRDFAGQFGTFYTGEADEVIHNLVTVLICPDGRIRDLWRGNEWTTDEALESIDALLGQT